MKKTLLCFSLSLFSFFANAQEFAPLQVTSGFNADVVANGVGTSLSSTTLAVDNANYAFITADFQATSGNAVIASAMPVNGLISSTATPGMQFQLASYSGNNSLRIATTNGTGSLVFTNQVSATRLFFLATSGSGPATITGTINFSDNTTQAITSSVIPDWYNSTTLPVAISGIGRVNRATDAIDTPAGNPRIYQLEIAVLPANQTKLISGITVTKTSTVEGVLNLFAVSAEILPTCPSPSGLTSTTTATEATVSWAAAVAAPAGGYDYYYSPTSEVPTATTVPSGNVASSQTSVTINTLATGQLYYFWIRSNCSEADKGIWKLTNFTTGQVVSTYTTGDISTLFNDGTITVNTTTTCPGVLTLNVPDGYQISSVQTSYSMQTASNGWMSEQRSILVCNTTNLKEASVTSGVGGTTGTYQYSRSNLNIANGATGAVQFELRTWRTYGSSGCNTDYNRVVNNTWTVTATYQPLLSVVSQNATSFKAYPNPVKDVLNISGDAVISEVTVYNYLGQKVMQQSANEQLVILNTSQLLTGNYMVIAKDIEGNQKTMKIVKQ